MMQTRKFRLQPVLSHKERLEDICQTELAAIEIAHARERHVLELLNELERRGLEQLDSQHGVGRLDVDSIALYFYNLQTLQDRIEQQQIALERLAEKAEKKRAQLIEISKEKKSLEKLKEVHDKEVARAEAKAENKILEDIATTQFHRHRRNRIEQ